MAIFHAKLPVYNSVRRERERRRRGTPQARGQATRAPHTVERPREHRGQATRAQPTLVATHAELLAASADGKGDRRQLSHVFEEHVRANLSPTPTVHESRDMIAASASECQKRGTAWLPAERSQELYA